MEKNGPFIWEDCIMKSVTEEGVIMTEGSGQQVYQKLGRTMRLDLWCLVKIFDYEM
jgi:predicted RNA-binding protein